MISSLSYILNSFSFNVYFKTIINYDTQTHLRGAKAAFAAGPRELAPRLARKRAKTALAAIASRKVHQEPKKESTSESELLSSEDELSTLIGDELSSVEDQDEL